MKAKGSERIVRFALVLLALSWVCLGPLSSSQLLAQAQVAQQIRYGTVVSVTQATVQVQSSGTGAVVGSTAGAVAGYALVGGRDRWLGGLVGGVLGGAIGRSAEKASKKKKGWELIIKIDGAQEIGIQLPGKKQEFESGDRVRLMTGAGGKTNVTHHTE